MGTPTSRPTRSSPREAARPSERKLNMNHSMMNVLRRMFALFVVAGLLLVAAPRALAVPPAIGESGISGQVLRRTLCPGDGPARYCFQPTEADVSFQPKSAVGATIVARTDAQGIFAML